MMTNNMFLVSSPTTFDVSPALSPSACPRSPEPAWRRCKSESTN